MKRTLFAFAFFCTASLTLAGPALAGPGTMVLMLHGKMMAVTPLDHDIVYANGTKVAKDGTVTMHGKAVILAEGEAISSEGILMKPLAIKAHGG